MKLQVRALTAEESATIRRWSQARSGAVRRRERALIVAGSAAGWWVSHIARLVGVSEATVRRWIKRFNAAGLDGLVDRPRAGRPATYSPDQVGEVVATALTKPDALGLPFGSWTLDRLEAYLNQERGIPIKRSRIDELLLDEGLRWRHQESWFGERAALEQPAADGPPSDEQPLDPEFARKRGRSSRSTRRRRPAA